MSSFLDQPQTAQGKAPFDEFLWVHAVIRRDLATVRRLADECIAGRAPDELAAKIGALERTGRSGSSRSTACATAASSTVTTTPRT